MKKIIQANVDLKYILAVTYVAVVLFSLFAFTFYHFNKPSNIFSGNNNEVISYNSVEYPITQNNQINIEANLGTNYVGSYTMSSQLFPNPEIISKFHESSVEEIIKKQQLQIDMIQSELNQAKYEAAMAKLDAEEAKIQIRYSNDNISVYSKEK